MLKKAYLEITSCCNLQCSFCPGTKRDKRFMSEAEFLVLARRLRPHTDFLYFHVMGEPLLHPLLARFLALAGELGFRVILTTNGVLLSQRQSDLLDASALHKVNLSLHAPESNMDIGMDFPAYLDACAAFASAASARGILCNLRLWNLDGSYAEGANERNEEILSHLRRTFPPSWTENTHGFRLQDRVFLEWGERFEWPDQAAPDFGQRGFCMALRDQVGVLCDGTVVPCCLDHEGDLALGNLLETDLQTILDGQMARELYQGFSARRRTQPLCRRCGYAKRFD